MGIIRTMELEGSALPYPGIVGSSGMELRYRSNRCLKVAVVTLLRFRNVAGMALNSFGPLTGNEFSRKFLAIVGALGLALGTLHNLPLLGSK